MGMMHILTVLVACVCVNADDVTTPAPLPPPPFHNQSYAEHMNMVQKTYNYIMSTVVDYTNEPFSSNYAMLLNALLTLSDRYRKDPTSYTATFVNTSVTAMTEALYHRPSFIATIKKSYEDIDFRYLRLMARLIEFECSPAEMYHCDTKINEYYEKELLERPSWVQTEYILAREALYALATSAEVLWTHTPTLEVMAKQVQPVLFFLTRPNSFQNIVINFARTMTILTNVSVSHRIVDLNQQ